MDRTVTTSFYEAARCLFEGLDAPQTGVVPGTIDEARVAIVRGTVRDAEGSPLSGTRVKVSKHPEYGETETDAAGEYALAVNGGEALTLRFEKEGLLPVQRRRVAEWQKFSVFPPAVLLPETDVATEVDLSAATAPVFAEGPTNADDSGARQQAVLIHPRTKVTLHLPDGSARTLHKFHLRTTEYTVGDQGVNAMPGELPAASGYTYATEFSIDEAREQGALRVEFDPPVVSYVDNFLGFPAGTSVPAGYYDSDKDQWQADENGLVIEVLAIKDNTATLDVTGDGKGDDMTSLAGLGVTAAELELIARRYDAGTSLWRVPLKHFSPWDFNWGFGPPADATSPEGGVDQAGALDCKTTVRGSIIGCEDQTLGEAIPLSGTPFTLHYQSERMPGRADSHDLLIRLSGSKVPKSLERIELEVEVLGKVSKQSFDPTPNLQHRFHWDGQDPWGRVWQGRQIAVVRVGYSYDGAYERTPGFGAPGTGVAITGDRTRREVTLWKEWRAGVGSLDAGPLGLGGWTLNAQHLYDPRGRVLHLGSGSQRSAEGLGTVVTTIAGTGEDGSSGDGGPAIEAQLAQPHGVVVAPDGTAFFADDLHHVLRKIDVNGTISTIAGTGTAEFAGDGARARDAGLNKPMGLALGRDGTLFVADGGNQRLRAITPDGRIRTVAGGGETRVDSEPVPALDAAFLEVHAVAVSSDGTVYLADDEDNRVYRVGTDGLVTLLAGGGTSDDNGELAAKVRLQSPLGLSLGPSGDLYIAEFDAHRVSRIDPSGRYWTVAGTGSPGFSGDRGPAVLAQLRNPHTVDVAPDGSLYVTDEGNRRVRRISPDGYIETVAGSGDALYNAEIGDNGPALAANFSQPRVVYVHKDGSLWIADYTDSRIRRIRPTLPGYTKGETLLASNDGDELFVFDTFGRHRSTLDAVTGVQLLEFEYDDAGRLTSISDQNGNRTSVARDREGQPEAVLGPYGQRTELAIGSDGYLRSLTNAAGERHSFTYKAGGLLETLTDPENPTENIHRFVYDELGRLLSDTSPGGLVQTLARSDTDAGFSVSLSTGLGRTRKHEVQDLGDGVSRRTVTLADGTTTITELAPGHTTRALPSGTLITTELSGDVRFGLQSPIATLVEVESGTLPLAQIRRSRNVELADLSDPLSLEVLEETTTVNNRATSREWNVAARTITTTTPEGRTVVEHWDEKGRISKIERGGLHAETLRYDRGRLASVLWGDREMTLEYAEDGYLATFNDATGTPTAFTRDAVGRIKQLTTADARTEFSYDAMSLLTGVKPPARDTHRFEYFPGGLVRTYQPPALGSGSGSGSTATAYTHSPDEELTRITQPGGRAVDFEYDRTTGKLARITLPSAKLTNTYDEKSGRVSAATFGTQTLSYDYNGELLAELTWSGDIKGSVTWGHDANFWVTSERVENELATTFQYDSDGLLIAAGSQTLGRDEHGFVTDTRLGSVLDASTYSAFGELESYTAGTGSAALYSSTFDRDALGRITRLTETIANETQVLEYSYHARGWLEAVVRDGEKLARYTYDPNGNRTEIRLPSETITATFDAQDRLEHQGETTFSYAPSGELTRKETPAGITRYTYDALGNLLEVVLPEGKTIEYIVDAQGRRVGRKVDGALVQGFLYRDALNPVAELNEQGRVRTVFVYASKTNVPDHMIRGGVRYRIISDWRGSPRLVVNTTTGVIAQRLDFDAWGNVLVDTKPGFQPFGFAGGLYDQDTGLLRFGARDFDAKIGRWTNKDPIRFRGGSANLYSYVGNDPVNHIDPSGLIPWLEIAYPFLIPLDSANWLGGLATLANVLTPGATTSLRWNGGNPVIILSNSPYTFGNQGITFGHVVALSPGATCLNHELQHVEQHDWLGPAYLPAHAAVQAYSWLTTASYDQGNPLETGPNAHPTRPWP